METTPTPAKVTWQYVPAADLPGATADLDAAFVEGRLIAELSEDREGWHEIAYRRGPWQVPSFMAYMTRAEAIEWVERNAVALYRGEVVA